MHHFDPEQALTQARREFGEHGGVSPSIERSSTFTVMEPGLMPEIFEGRTAAVVISTAATSIPRWTYLTAIWRSWKAPSSP